jgi:hypothetical protein
MLAAFGLTPLANARAFSLNCGTPQGFQSHGRSIELKTQGHWDSLGFGHARLNYQLQFGIDCVAGESCWALGQSVGTGVVANRDYRPNRYQNYQQFVLDPMPEVEHAYLLLPDPVPDQATSFRAYAMMDAVHGSFGATIPLLCQGEPMISLNSSISESAAAELARANRIIHEEYGFPALHLLAKADALQKEIAAGDQDKVSVSKATQLALAVILDSFDAIEAPLNIAAHGWASTHGQRLSGDLTVDQKTAARAFLRKEMQASQTSLALHLGGIVKGQDYPPEQGESTRDNWIFVLHVPTLSDHLYWVIVDRRGQNEPYIYGFN